MRLVAGRIAAAIGAVLVVVAATLAYAVHGASAAPLGTVTLTQQSGLVTDTPMFARGTSSLACPATFGEEAALKIAPKGTTNDRDFRNLAPSVGGGTFDQAPVKIDVTKSMQTALDNTPPAAGVYIVVIRCYSLTAGVHADMFVTEVTVTGNAWTTGVPAVPTTTALGITPANGQDLGEDVTLTATVTPATAVGTVQFLADGEPIGDAVSVADGTATLTTTDLELGGHLMRAQFTPERADSFDPSSSPAQLYVINGEGPGPVTTGILVSTAPPSPQPAGTPVTLTATVVPATATGRVSFQNGRDNDMGTVDLNNGTATFTVPAGATQSGNRTFGAKYLPTTGSSYQPSVSPDLIYVFTGTNPSQSSSSSASASASTSATNSASASASESSTPTSTATTDPTGNLAKTGLNVPLISIAGLLLVGLGVLAIWGSRRGGTGT